MGRVYSDWDSLSLKYGGEVFLGRRSIFCMSILISSSSGIRSDGMPLLQLIIIYHKQDTSSSKKKSPTNYGKRES